MNVSYSLSEASKLFHSIIADGMQDLLNVVVVVGILEILLLFLNSYLDIFETVGGIHRYKQYVKNHVVHKIQVSHVTIT